MASAWVVDSGSKSFLASSDEAIQLEVIQQHTCGPCKDDGKTKEGKYFCEKCKDYLCAGCRKEHGEFRQTKNHKVIPAPKSKGLTSVRGTFSIMCGCFEKQPVAVYCERHAVVICSNCKEFRHRNCKTRPIKDKVTKDTKREFNDILDTAKSLKAALENCIKDVEENQKKLDDYKEQCKNEIAAFRIEMNKILDNLEEETYKHLETKKNQQKEVIEKQLTAITASMRALNTDLGIIHNANKTCRDEVMFATNVHMLKSIAEYKDLIQDIRSGLEKPQLAFHENSELTEFLVSMEDFGYIEPSKTGWSHQFYPVLLDMEVKATKTVDISLPDDGSPSYITDCTFMSDGRILLCDYGNNKLKLIDSDMHVKGSLALKGKPYNVAAIGDNEAIITFLDREIQNLQYIVTDPELKLRKMITLPEKCYGLFVANEKIYTAYHKDSGHDEIWRLDRAGNILRKIVLIQNNSGRPDYLGLCLASSSPNAYLIDWDKSRVTCFKLNGRTVYRYEDQELIRPNGIYVDSAGNSLVCGSSSNNVVIITADGRTHRELLTSKDIRYPRCIDYRPENNMLIVGCYDNPKLFVYKLGK